ncbi:hypothetical protein SDC9_201370 [bioreactor metagenome]|uniref:Uncharacterized protein n=1 Tax=bioreactor metagenome TaxID=1076179 RepID=A0A645IZP0_9ZZZZ
MRGEEGVQVGGFLLADPGGQIFKQALIGGVVGVVGGVDQDVGNVAGRKHGGFDLIPVGGNLLPGDFNAGFLLHLLEPLHGGKLLGQGVFGNQAGELHRRFRGGGQGQQGQQQGNGQQDNKNTLCLHGASLHMYFSLVGTDSLLR